MLILSVCLAATQPYTARDQVMLKRVSDLAVSPDGEQTVFQLRTTDYEANLGRFDLWIARTGGGEPRALTSHPANDTDPQWHDGFVYFLSTRSGSSQVWRISPSGGEAEQVTALPIDVEAYRAGAQLAVALETDVACGDSDCAAQRAEEKKRVKATGMLYTGLLFRHWDRWSQGLRLHWFVVTQKTKARDLLPGVEMDAPTRPHGDSKQATFTPDGKGLVYVARDPGANEALSTDLDLFVVALDGKSQPKKLTTDNRGSDDTPVFSPDGKSLAYVSMARAGFESDKQRLMVRDWTTGQTRVLTDAWDRSVASFAWSSDSRTIAVTADDLGQKPLFTVDVASGKVTKLVGGGNINEVAAAKDGRFVYTFDDLKSPADIYVWNKGASKPLTHVNQDALKSLAFGDFEQFSFKGASGDTVYAYLVKPVGFDAKKKYPLAFIIHGGPQGSFGNHFHYRWNPQVYAARGYAVVMVDFHGSTGYGQAFTDAISRDWGGKPLEDLQKGFDAAVAKYGFIDANRACALGASYGGFMINWIAGNWPDRFKCLVNHDGNLDEKMAYYDTEELWFPEWEHGGTPWDNPTGYSKHNPIDHVGKWKTPMLVVHGGKDYRVVDTQGMSTFTALQRRGIPSKFLYFPDENHWVLKPQNSVQWHDTVLGWLDEWTSNAKALHPTTQR